MTQKHNSVIEERTIKLETNLFNDRKEVNRESVSEMTPFDSQLVNRCEVGGSFQFLRRTTRQQHMKKTKQQRRRRDTFHFLKFTFPLSFNRLHPQQSSLVVHVVCPTERPPPEFPDSRSNLRSYLLKARYAGLLSGSG